MPQHFAVASLSRRSLRRYDLPMLARLEHHPAAPADSAVVWMHGLGASSSDFLQLLPHLDLPTTRFIFPQAPQRAVTINAGYVMPAWYDIRTLKPGPDREDVAGIEASAQQLRALLDRERERGIAPSRLIVAGFSQGGAMALHVAHRYPHALGGIVVLSAYPLVPERWGEGHAANADTPAFCAHGTRDDVVPISRGRAAAALLGERARWRQHPMGHEVCLEEITDLRDWLHTRLG